MGAGNMKKHFRMKHEFQLKNNQFEKKEQPIIIHVSGKKPSPWSKYCIEVGENKFKCVICSNVLNMPKAHGNLKRHIKLRHPKVYEQETKESLKYFWKQFGINSEVESSKITKENENVLEEEEIEEVVLGEAEYLEEYIDDGDIANETIAIVTSDPEIEKKMADLENTMKQGKPKGKDSNLETGPVSSDKSDTNAESAVIHEFTYHDVNKIVDFGNIDYLNEDDVNFEAKVKWLADRVVPCRKTYRTRVWNFYNEYKKGHIYECKICHRKLATDPTSSSNLKRHIGLVHPKAFEIIANCPNFSKVSRDTINRVQKYFITPTDEKFETSYFEDQGDNKYKCKSCNEVIHSNVADSLLLFKHINEKHSDEIIGGIEQPVAGDEEISVVFVKKKDLQQSKSSF